MDNLIEFFVWVFDMILNILVALIFVWILIFIVKAIYWAFVFAVSGVVIIFKLFI